MKGETINHSVKEKVSIIALDNIDQVVENAILLDTVVSDNSSKSKMPNTAFMHSFYALFDYGNGIELIKLYVEEALSNNEQVVFSRAYELKDIQKIADMPDGVHFQKEGLTDGTSTIISISDLYSLVKQFDKDFNPGKPVNPALLNDDGTPKVFYHGTNAQFTAFDKCQKVIW